MAQPPRWRPGPFSTGNAMHDNALDTAFKAIFDQVYGLEQQAINGAVAGMANASGTTTVTGNKKGIATGLATVSNVVACLDGSTGIIETVTAQPSPNAKGAIDIYVWDAGPVPSTVARAVRWIAVGTPVVEANP